MRRTRLFSSIYSNKLRLKRQVVGGEVDPTLLPWGSYLQQPVQIKVDKPPAARPDTRGFRVRWRHTPSVWEEAHKSRVIKETTNLYLISNLKQNLVPLRLFSLHVGDGGPWGCPAVILIIDEVSHDPGYWLSKLQPQLFIQPADQVAAAGVCVCVHVCLRVCVSTSLFRSEWRDWITAVVL